MAFSVNPADLHESSRLAARSAYDVEALPGDLGRVLRALGEAGGSPDVAAAGQAAARRWQPAAEGMAREARALAQGLGGVGGDYEAAEGAQVRRFGAS